MGTAGGTALLPGPGWVADGWRGGGVDGGASSFGSNVLHVDTQGYIWLFGLLDPSTNGFLSVKNSALQCEACNAFFWLSFGPLRQIRVKGTAASTVSAVLHYFSFLY